MTKYYSRDEDIERAARGVLDRSLPKVEWTHAAHFAVTLWLLRHRPDPALEARMPSFIRAYNEATGVWNTETSGYHETITLASIAAARAFLGRHPASQPLHEIMDLLMRSPLGRSDWPLAYWSKERLFSAEARRCWIDPDLQPFSGELELSR
jgi:hypothetical protein